MTAIRIVILCVSAALICATLRLQKPELATALSLATGLLALLLTSDTLSVTSNAIRQFSNLAQFDSDISSALLKATGITIISELGAQICSDAGESALAGRIRLAARLVMLGMALPMLLQICDMVGQILV